MVTDWRYSKGWIDLLLIPFRPFRVQSSHCRQLCVLYSLSPSEHQSFRSNCKLSCDEVRSARLSKANDVMRALSKVTFAIRNAQRKYSILPPSSKILIALSGGQDSTALTEALLSLHRTVPWIGIDAAHCDHGWPLDAGNAEHVASYASLRDLPLKILKARESIPTTEAAAREWRYRLLAGYATEIGCNAVVTGHTMTDVSETLLMGLSRGAVVPMRWERMLTTNIKLVRPLLEIPRSLTRTVCKEQGVPIWEDAYNDDEKYLRNRVRKRVFPVMRDQLNPRVEQGFARVTDVLREEYDFLDEVCEKLYETTVRYDGGIWMDGGLLMGVHRAIRRRVVKKALAEVEATKKCVYGQVESVCEVLEGRRRAYVAGGREVCWIGDEVFIPAREGVPGVVKTRGSDVVDKPVQSQVTVMDKTVLPLQSFRKPVFVK